MSIFTNKSCLFENTSEEEIRNIEIDDNMDTPGMDVVNDEEIMESYLGVMNAAFLLESTEFQGEQDIAVMKATEVPEEKVEQKQTELIAAVTEAQIKLIERVRNLIRLIKEKIMNFVKKLREFGQSRVLSIRGWLKVNSKKLSGLNGINVTASQLPSYRNLRSDFDNALNRFKEALNVGNAQDLANSGPREDFKVVLSDIKQLLCGDPNAEMKEYRDKILAHSVVDKVDKTFTNGRDIVTAFEATLKRLEEVVQYPRKLEEQVRSVERIASQAQRINNSADVENDSAAQVITSIAGFARDGLNLLVVAVDVWKTIIYQQLPVLKKAAVEAMKTSKTKSSEQIDQRKATSNQKLITA